AHDARQHQQRGRRLEQDDAQDPGDEVAHLPGFFLLAGFFSFGGSDLPYANALSAHLRSAARSATSSFGATTYSFMGRPFRGSNCRAPLAKSASRGPSSSRKTTLSSNNEKKRLPFTKAAG